MTAEMAHEEFIELNANVLELTGVDAQKRTAILREHVEALLDRHKVEKDARLMDSFERSRGCKLVVPISYKANVGSVRILRNFSVRQEPALNMTIAEALLATLATSPLFSPLSLIKGGATTEYIGGDTTISDPTQNLLDEAYGTFGSEALVACLLSIGCGHPGLIAAESASDVATWYRLTDKLLADGERKAQQLESRMGHLGLYYRFSVTLGLERDVTPDIGTTLAHTEVYLADVAISHKLDLCIDALKSQSGIASLEQLQHSGGQSVLGPSVPPLTKTFVMRKEPWDFIEQALLKPTNEDTYGQRMLAVTGVGGCGKTQMILKFVRVHGKDFISCCFVDGSSEARIRSDITRHVRSLGAEYSQKTFDDCLVFLAHSSSQGTRLIVYDNVDDPELDILPLIPDGEGCTIIFTSRNRSIGELCPEAHLELDVMSLDESVQLLLFTHQQSSPPTEPDREEARSIAQALGCLPIALTQARSYMYQTKCSRSSYLEILLNNRDKLLAQPVKYQRDMRHVSTYAAFDASLASLPPRALQFIRLLSYFHWNAFPLHLISIAANHSFSDYDYQFFDHNNDYHAARTLLREIFEPTGQWDTSDLNDIMISLQNYSLVTLATGVDTTLLQMHLLAHGWVRVRIPTEDQGKYESAAILLLALGARAEHTPSTPYLASHVTHFSPIWDRLSINDAGAFGLILDEAGFYESALLLRERVWAGLKGLVNPRSFEALWALASTYRNMGQYSQAEKILEELSTLRKETLGDRHPSTITALSGLATTYRDSGRFHDAERLAKEVLDLRTEFLGEHHPDTVAASSNLAVIYRDLGRMEEARQLQESVLRLRKDTLGDHHLDTLIASHNLAVTYDDLGRLEEAALLQTNVLKLMKKVLGERHPDTISAANNLATTYSQQRRSTDAKLLREDVLQWRTDILGEKHPDTIAASNNLAETYSNLGLSDKAEALQVSVLHLRQEVLGEDHPDTMSARYNLSLILVELGRLDEAKGLQERVVGWRKSTLGESHPLTINAMLSLAETYVSLPETAHALETLNTVKHVIAETVGRTDHRYQWCIELNGRALDQEKSQGTSRKGPQVLQTSKRGGGRRRQTARKSFQRMG
ncbi:hypothetical protein M408DRAFT_271216 [Serendipita vermifera MAFF 305830]|uniref:NB-ARC domain-containing protein n=1 Tax=Serendipita vermifera MAFF 305830 TaxID=933852 RepID=A0A0C3BH90_SERVB|nr:hypothetical protein M408DRAFT_271216 [Serendipita vermifera MAFF 305830]